MIFLRGPTLFVYLGQICSVALAVKEKAECPYFSMSKIFCFRHVETFSFDAFKQSV